jgi:hypothetical protein
VARARCTGSGPLLSDHALQVRLHALWVRHGTACSNVRRCVAAPAGQQAAWEVKVEQEEHQDRDPAFLQEEFVVLGISSTPTLHPDWTFLQEEDNPVCGINCSRGEVRILGKGKFRYEPVVAGEMIRLGVDLRGPKRYLVIHKYTSSQPDRLLVRLELPATLAVAYPVVVVQNRLSCTGRAYEAAISVASPPPAFDFASWMSNAELQERNRPRFGGLSVAAALHDTPRQRFVVRLPSLPPS